MNAQTPRTTSASGSASSLLDCLVGDLIDFRHPTPKVFGFEKLATN